MEKLNYSSRPPKKAELQEGVDYYIENGFWVFLPAYHLKRGYCCKNGCRHCPYGFKKLNC